MSIKFCGDFNFRKSIITYKSNIEGQKTAFSLIFYNKTPRAGLVNKKIDALIGK